MVDVTQTQNPGSARSWIWADRSSTKPDNPVRRWLGRQRDDGVQEKHRPPALRRLIIRPAT
jgi:hypothetical protein